MLAKLLDYLDRIYPGINNREPFLGKRLVCRAILSGIYRINKLLCWYYHRIDKNRIPKPEECDYVVSLTTYPARVNNVWRVIEMAAHQKGIKDKYAICLYLIESEFEGLELPQEIKDLQQRGLTVKFNKENLKCHNKYFYAFQDYPEKNVITIDDDLQYNHHTISGLIRKSKEFRGCVVFNLGTLIKGNYSQWEHCTTKDTPTQNAFPCGVGGVLYPPHACSKDVFDKETIRKTCLCADDLWLSFMERVNGTQMVYTGMVSTFMVLPDSDQKSALYLENTSVIDNGNDRQIKEISSWAMKKMNCDFYVNISK